MAVISLNTSSPKARKGGSEVSRLESLVVSSAARLCVDELVLLPMVIVMLFVGAVGLAYAAGLVR